MTEQGRAELDVRILLAELQAHQENTGEYLEAEDAAVVAEIAARYAQPKES